MSLMMKVDECVVVREIDESVSKSNIDGSLLKKCQCSM